MSGALKVVAGLLVGIVLTAGALFGLNKMGLVGGADALHHVDGHWWHPRGHLGIGR